MIFLFAAGCGLVADGPADGDRPNPQPAGGTGTIIFEAQTIPAAQAGSFTYTGVPTGTLRVDSSLVVSDLEPGTYTSTQIDPAPDFDLAAVECTDSQPEGLASMGDPQTRTAVINLDANETVTCVFTNAQRGSLVIASQTEPQGTAGQFQYTGVPTGTLPSNGTLVVANLEPGTYTSTQVDPAPDFDLTAVRCDDGGSATTSSGDPQTRTAIFNLDPGEMVTCTFVNTRRGTAVIRAETEPEGLEGLFQYTGVPTGTVTTGGDLVTANLSPGTYTSTQVDPAPDFELLEVRCDDGDSATPSSGDPATRTAIFNLDAGETVTCTFVNRGPDVPPDGGAGAPGAGAGEDQDPGRNPFLDPDEHLADFPLPADYPQLPDLPPEAGTVALPLAGPWTVTHLEGIMDCGVSVLEIPASAPESGVLSISEDGQQITGTGLEDADGAPVTLTADPDITGLFAGSFDGTQEGVPVTIYYYWQVVTEEYIVGYLTASVTAEGVSCAVYRPFWLVYDG